MAEVLAVVPARGGSVGVPRKNLAQVGGVPLIARAVRSCVRAERVGRVVVTTDDEEIAEAATSAGAEVLMRASHLATAESPSEAALLDVLDRLDRQGYVPDVLAFVQCTSPLVEASHIDATVRALDDTSVDSALAVVPFERFVWAEDASGESVGVNHDPSVRLRRQDRTDQYLETGAVYAMRVRGFRQSRHRFFGKVALVPVDRYLEAEVDSLLDLEIVRCLARERDGEVSWGSVRGLVMDFDGVMTDNLVHVDQDGHESVTVSRSDGFGLSELRERGLPMLVLSSEVNPVVGKRMAKLGVAFQQGVAHKKAILREWLADTGVDAEACAFVGNDLNDLECFVLVGIGIAVADAHPRLKELATYTTARPGGRGAIREVVDLILREMEEPA